MLPTVPLVPMLRENKSPVAVAAEPGDQSKARRLPVVRPVEVEVTLIALPVVKELAVTVKASVVVPVKVWE